MIILIWIVKISNIVWAYISILVSVLVIQINSKCPFLTKWLITTIGIYRCKAFHRWINTLWFTDFKMEMSTGVSLLRTAQSLLTGRTIRCWKELEGWKELDCWKVSRCWVVLDCWMVAEYWVKKVNSFKLHSYGPSSSLRKPVENAHALIAHTYGMMSPINSKFQWVQNSPFLRNLSHTVMCITKAQLRLHGCAF